MADLWRAIGELAAAMHADRIVAAAEVIRRLRSATEFERAKSAFGPNVDQERLERVRASWAAMPRVAPSEIAAALEGAANAAAILDTSSAIELVWTGPKTGLIPTRRTEQVILEVVDTARNDIFLVTYAFYKASTVVEALNAAVDRGVTVRILLESSTERGGAIRGDAVKTMAEAVPGATVYVWDVASKKREGDVSACVHAKCAVADGTLVFVSSANLTSAALERNMELGVLIRGGDVPGRLRAHLEALVATNVIREWCD